MSEFVYPDSPRSEMLSYVPESARRVLDVGCSSGSFGAALKNVRPQVQVVGVESDALTASRASQRLDEVFTGPFPDALPGVAGPFDVVIANDVIEHIVDPENFVRQLKQRLTADGTLVASIPNVRFAPVWLDLVFRGRWDYRDQGVLDRTHLRFFTRRSIIRLFEAGGLRVVSLSRINVPGSRRARWAARLLEIVGGDLVAPQFAIVATRCESTG